MSWRNLVWTIHDLHRCLTDGFELFALRARELGQCVWVFGERILSVDSQCCRLEV